MSSTKKLPLAKIKLAVGTHWVEGWSNVTRLPNSKKRAEELHPSSFPYCALRHAHDLIVSGGDAEHFNMSASMEYYVSVGTIAHSVFQKVMRLQSSEDQYVIGDWTCPSCSHENLFRPYTRCESCDSPSIVSQVNLQVQKQDAGEIGFEYGKRTIGHTDEVLYSSGHYYVIDYKTSSVAAIERYKKYGKGLPYKSNISQIQAYVPLLEQKYADRGIKISGWVLLYAARDKPMEHYALCAGVVNDEDREPLLVALQKADKMFDVIRRIIAEPINNGTKILNGDPAKVDKFCRNLCKNKLCPSAEYYEQEIHDKYDPCPIAALDMCHTDDSAETLIKRAIVKYNRTVEE